MTIDKYKDSNLSAEVIEQRTAFRNRLLKFRQLQLFFQPEVTPMFTSQGTPPSATTQDDGDDIQNASLLLPSSMPPDILAKTSPKLLRMERDLRLGQCQDALSQLREHLHSRARILKDKYVNVRHQVPNTRSNSLLDRVSVKVDASVSKYNAAYTSLLALDSDPNAKWRSELQPLHQHDIRSMSDAEKPVTAMGRDLLPGGVPPEGSRTLSWIWRGAHNDASSTPGFHECMCATTNPLSF